MATYVEGLREAVRDLQALGVDLEDIKDAFAEIAAQGARIAADLAPHRSGKLAASIRGNRAKGKAIITAGRATVPYAGPVNYGWARRGIKADRFLQKADERIAPKAVDSLIKAIDDLITTRGF